MFVVKYSGPFGFIKPWTAVRDSETYSQNFLTPSIIEGIEKKLFPELLEVEYYDRRIIRHRLTYSGLSPQQEVTQPKALKETKDKGRKFITITRSRAVITRGLLINPILFLAFARQEFAEVAIRQHICLCRNEDILLPIKFTSEDYIVEISVEEFDKPDIGYNGFELLFHPSGNSQQSFITGYNRFHKNAPMYGSIHIVGNNPLSGSEE